MKSRFVAAAISTNKRLWVVLLIFGAVLLFMRIMCVPSIAQAEGERVLEDLIPKHVPIKVKIKKEKEQSFKDLKNEKWAREFELELTNTGGKAIYSLSLMLVL